MFRALEEVPVERRDGMQFLLENMPVRDLRGLSADFLLADVARAYEAWEQAPWSKSIPKEIYLNEILPYANASERRDPWREEMRARCLPLIEGCTTPGQAARRLNETLFSLVKVKYSTARAKADQSPAESMASGLASCTGLSILLVDACRSVGIPARLVGIPDWVDGRGNHTWVEVWSTGTWHFLGAAEPDGRGLDHAWFERDAALAQKNSPRHAIYAVSFRRTGLAFPIAWGPDAGGVDAVNVTDRYAPIAATAQQLTAGSAMTRLMIRVRDHLTGPRIAVGVDLQCLEAALPHWKGVTKDETADTNDMLTFDLPQQQEYQVNVTDHSGGEAHSRGTTLHYSTGTKTQDTLDFSLDGVLPWAPYRITLGKGSTEELSRALPPCFAANPDRRSERQLDPALDGILAHYPEATRELVWQTYRASPAHVTWRADHAAGRVQSDEHVSPYTLRKVGDKPAQGWGLVIAMHGGGGAPKEVNDSQWRIMQSYYHDHPEVGGGYLYLALRAPNDTWNGFYDDYVYPLVDRLIRQVAVSEELDPDRVYLIGYSHGGYGAFAIGPKMPDRFAAVHSSAAAPTDGLVSPKTLRNTPFSFAVGEFDSAYGRRERCEAFARSVQDLRGDQKDAFPVTFSLVPGRHHSDLPDHDQLQEMLSLRRQPVPRELTWEQTDSVVKNFYWLTDPAPVKGHEIDATCRDNRLTIGSHREVARFAVLLDERLVDFDRPLVVEHDGQTDEIKVRPHLAELCRSLLERGDPGLAFTCRLEFEAAEDGKLRLSPPPP